jgi:hypothetical protein
VTLRARWVTLRARWVTLRARWVTLRARWALQVPSGMRMQPGAPMHPVLASLTLAPGRSALAMLNQGPSLAAATLDAAGKAVSGVLTNKVRESVCC